MAGLFGRIGRAISSNDVSEARGNSSFEEKYGVLDRLKVLYDKLASQASDNLSTFLKIYDAGGLITATDLAGALQELATSIASGGGTVAAAVAVTNGGAGNSGKLFKVDSQGKAAGRVLETDGTKLDSLAKGNVAAAAPTTGDDSSAGYSAGSWWLDTTLNGGAGGLWVCLSAGVGTAAWVRVDGVPKRASTLAAVNADQVTGSGETAHTSILALQSLLGAARVGERFEFGFACRVVGANGNDTLTTKLKFGSVTLVTVPPADVTVDDVIRASGEFEIVTAGASGAIQGSGVITCLFQQGGAGATLMALSVPFALHQESATPNLTTAALVVTQQFSSASATNKVNLVEIWLRRKALGT